MVEQGKEKPQMEYRYLGNSGLKVSVIGYGTYMFAGSATDPEKLTTDCLRRVLEYGVNFIDTAEVYDDGKAEIALGKAIKELKVRREELVISTKLFWENMVHTTNVNGKGLSRKKIYEGVKNSLRRLQLEYVDVIFAHRPDYDTPLEETCRSFSWIIDQGLAFYWGTSEWSAARITDAIDICQKNGLHAPIVEQPQYNMLERERFEKEYRTIYERFGYGSTVWSPLCGGILSGKYNDGSVPEDTQRGKTNVFSKWVVTKYFGEEKKEKTTKTLKALGEIAKELGCTQAQLALAWTIANKDVSTQLLGFSRVEQIDENIQALNIYKNWTKELEDKCQKALGNQPEIDFDFRNSKPLPQRRQLAVFGNSSQ